MAHQLNRPELTVQADRRYLAAIQSLRTAIMLPQPPFENMRAVSNEFLQSVLLLDLYEKIGSHRHIIAPNASSSWLSHVVGALNIIQTRRRSEFFDPITQQLAGRIVFALTMSYEIAGLRPTRALTALRNDLARHVQSPRLIFVDLLSAIIDLRAKMKNAGLAVDAFLLQARELNTQLANAEKNLPNSWRPRKVYNNSPIVFGHQYDLYPDHHASQIFNGFRVMRLDMLATIQRLSGSKSAAEDVVTLTQDICASAPQFILPGAKPENTVPLSPLQKLQCYGTLTALYAAAQHTADHHMRGWILQSLAFMADNGVKMARDVGHILTSSPETDYWVVFAMLGSCGITAA